MLLENHINDQLTYEPTFSMYATMRINDNIILSIINIGFSNTIKNND